MDRIFLTFISRFNIQWLERDAHPLDQFSCDTVFRLVIQGHYIMSTLQEKALLVKYQSQPEPAEPHRSCKRIQSYKKGAKRTNVSMCPTQDDTEI